MEPERIVDFQSANSINDIHDHNTSISDDEAQTLAKYCDVVWSCASKAVREIVGNRSKL